MIKVGDRLFCAYLVDRKIVMSEYEYLGIAGKSHLFFGVDPLCSGVTFADNGDWEEKIPLSRSKKDALGKLLEATESSIRWWQNNRAKKMREIASIEQTLDGFAEDFCLLKSALSSFEEAS